MKGKNIYLKAKGLHEKMYRYPTTLTPSEQDNIYGQYFKLIKHAAYLGHVEAQFDLGQQYEDTSFLGSPNPNYNPQKCVYWYTKACTQKHLIACNNLAHFYEKGEGCQQNLKKALSLYKKSFDLGYDIGKKNYKLLIKQMSAGGIYNTKNT